MEPIIASILDTDIYKLTQQSAVIFSKFAGIRYDSIQVVYSFINRGHTQFPPGFAEKLKAQISLMKDIRLTSSERDFLKNKCWYLRDSYLEWLSGYAFNPSEVKVLQTGGELNITISGPWRNTILWEVPLMALISEMYFSETGQTPDGEAGYRAHVKAAKIKANKITVADFGTRRRFSLQAQREVVQILSEVQPHFIGSSNPMLCKEMSLLPVGTNAHEWYQAHAALFGYNRANYYALEAWANEYDGALGHALTDTFTSNVFFRDFNLKHATLFSGLRQDSGDPIKFVDATCQHYEKLRIDPRTKTIIFSDGLTVDNAVAIATYCEGKIKCAFGIGTSISNDVGVKPLNMVIKLTECNGIPTVKLSDVEGKATGEPKTIQVCKQTLGIP